MQQDTENITYQGHWTPVRLGGLSAALFLLVAITVAIYQHRVAAGYCFEDMRASVNEKQTLQRINELCVARDRAIAFSFLGSCVLGLAVGYVRVRGLRTDAARRKTVAQLANSEQRFRQLAETANDAVCTLDIAGHILFWNKAAAQLFNLSTTDAKGKKLETLILPEVSVQDFRNVLQRYSETSKTDSSGKIVELLVHDTAGRMFYAEFSLATIWVNTAWQCVVILRDISQRKRDETKLQNALQESAKNQKALETANNQLENAILKAKELTTLAENTHQAKIRFLTNMSHEIRTPLNGIIGHAQMLVSDPEFPLHQHEKLEVIRNSGEHLLTIINDILDISKIEAGKLELTAETFDLPSFIHDIDEMMHGWVEKQQLEYASKPFNFRSNRPAIRLPHNVVGDSKRLRQVLINLLRNAIKFTQKGSITLKIGRTPDVNKPFSIRFMIEDTGIGIAPKNQELIFEAFEQIDSIKNNPEDTGLGLTISKKLIEIMGGTLQLESELGQGSRFWFDVHLPSDVQNIEELDPNASPIINYIGARQSILIVEDVESNRSALTKLLFSIKFQVIEADSADEALLLLKDYIPNLIITDLIMPGISGEDFIKIMKSNPKTENIPIIAISATPDLEQIKSAEAAGCDFFMPKPIRTHKLFSYIGELLELEWIHKNSDDAKKVSTEYLHTPSPFPKPQKAVIQRMFDMAMVGDLLSLRDYAEVLRQDYRYEAFSKKIIRHAKAFESAHLCSFLKLILDEQTSAKTDKHN